MLVSFMAYIAALKGLSLSDEDIDTIGGIEKLYSTARGKQEITCLKEIIAVLDEIPGGLDKAYVRQMYKQYKRISKGG